MSWDSTLIVWTPNLMLLRTTIHMAARRKHLAELQLLEIELREGPRLYSESLTFEQGHTSHGTEHGRDKAG